MTMKRFPDNARVVFIGDSITAANITLPYIIHTDKTQKIAKDIRFFNCGVAGGSARFARISYDSDIARYNPTHAVVSFGINDSHRDVLAQPRSKERQDHLYGAYENYKANMTALVDRLLADGVSVTLFTPAPYDEYTVSENPALRGGFALMQGYAEFVRNLARERGTDLCDIHARMSCILETDRVFSPDHIHPTPHGYFTLARIILEEQGITVGDEYPIPDYFARWHSYVAPLRKLLAAECMIVNDFNAPTEKKMQMMNNRVENENWGQPIFETYIRDYTLNKPREAELYRMVDLTYEEDII